MQFRRNRGEVPRGLFHALFTRSYTAKLRTHRLTYDNCTQIRWECQRPCKGNRAPLPRNVPGPKNSCLIILSTISCKEVRREIDESSSDFAVLGRRCLTAERRLKPAVGEGNPSWRCGLPASTRGHDVRWATWRKWSRFPFPPFWTGEWGSWGGGSEKSRNSQEGRQGFRGMASLLGRQAARSPSTPPCPRACWRAFPGTSAWHVARASAYCRERPGSHR